jgi:hypothetical protein
MKFARREEVSVEHIPVPSLAEEVAAVEAKLAVAFDRFVDDHAVVGVPRPSIVAWAWGEIGKLPGPRLGLYSRIVRFIET